MGQIQLNQVTKSFGDVQVIPPLDLTIEDGEFTVFVGPSGCGKSTFLRSINRINERLGYVRTTGSIRVLGHDIYAPEVDLTVSQVSSETT